MRLRVMKTRALSHLNQGQSDCPWETSNLAEMVWSQLIEVVVGQSITNLSSQRYRPTTNFSRYNQNVRINLYQDSSCQTRGYLSNRWEFRKSSGIHSAIYPHANYKSVDSSKLLSSRSTHSRTRVSVESGWETGSNTIRGIGTSAFHHKLSD